MSHPELTQELLDQQRKKVSEMPPLPFPSVIRSENVEHIGFKGKFSTKPKEDFDIPQDVMDRTFEKMEKLAPFFLNTDKEAFTNSDRKLLIEIRNLLQNLELRVSPSPSLLILGDAVTEEWEKITKRGH
jgi:hypothetical protein